MQNNIVSFTTWPNVFFCTLLCSYFSAMCNFFPWIIVFILLKHSTVFSGCDWYKVAFSWFFIFHSMQYGPSFSSPAFSIFQSGIFGLQIFQPWHFGSPFSGPALSVDPFNTRLFCHHTVTKSFTCALLFTNPVIYLLTLSVILCLQCFDVVG